MNKDIKLVKNGRGAYLQKLMFSGLLALLFIAGINSTVFAADDPNNYRTYSFNQSILPVLNINSLSSGVNVIEVQATNSLEEDAPVSSGYITVFRL